jgi:hypothetical protein
MLFLPLEGRYTECGSIDEILDDSYLSQVLQIVNNWLQSDILTIDETEHLIQVTTPEELTALIGAAAVDRVRVDGIPIQPFFVLCDIWNALIDGSPFRAEIARYRDKQNVFETQHKPEYAFVYPPFYTADPSIRAINTLSSHELYVPRLWYYLIVESDVLDQRLAETIALFQLTWKLRFTFQVYESGSHQDDLDPFQRLFIAAQDHITRERTQ